MTCGSCKWFSTGPAMTWEFFPSQPVIRRHSKSDFCAIDGPIPVYSNTSSVSASFADRPTTEDHPACSRYEAKGKV